MAFDVGYTAPGGNFVFAATSSDDVPHVLQGQWDGSLGGANLNSQIIPTFSTVSALASAYTSIPDTQKPALARVTGLGLYQWIPSPTSLWVPALGASTLYNAATQSAASVNSGSPIIGTTGTIVINVPQYPIIALVNYRARVTQSGGTTSIDTYVNVNGANDGYQTLSSFTGSTSVSLMVTIPGTAQSGASTFTLRGGLQYNTGASGSTATVDGSDTRYTTLTALVIPKFGNVGMTPF